MKAFSIHLGSSSCTCRYYSHRHHALYLSVLVYRIPPAEYLQNTTVAPTPASQISIDGHSVDHRVENFRKQMEINTRIFQIGVWLKCRGVGAPRGQMLVRVGYVFTIYHKGKDGGNKRGVGTPRVQIPRSASTLFRICAHVFVACSQLL